MAQTNISIRIDEDIKRDAENIFSQLGLTLSAATNVFYRQVVRTQGIPFNLTISDVDQKRQARKKLGEAFRMIQQQSVANSTDNLTMDEIDSIIKECRQEKSVLT